MVSCSNDTRATIPQPVERSPDGDLIVLPAPRPEIVEDRFCQRAFDCVHREYPNKISHVLNDDSDVNAPSTLTPMFYGCFDWHSAVHGHWLLVGVIRSTDSLAPLENVIVAQMSQWLPKLAYSIRLGTHNQSAWNK